ncbi:MAG: hypothetical protein AB7G93_22590 [Bdellovibrionales bacterium]
MRNLGIVLALYFVSNMAATNAFAVNLCEEAEGSFRREYTFTFSDAKGNGFKPYFSKRAQCEEAAERMRKEEVRTKFCGCASAFAKTQTVIVSVAALRSLSTNKEMLYCYEVDQDGVVTKYHVNTWGMNELDAGERSIKCENARVAELATPLRTTPVGYSGNRVLTALPPAGLVPTRADLPATAGR